ncbi:MAG: hypothetical protein H9533_11425 [Rhodobacteraceae bacterium]|nr:hypothetical protein [Paracoccaceae bacterium]
MLTFSIVGGADAARFTIDPATGVLSFLSAPDFEGQNSVSGDDVYDVTIRVADGRGGQQDVTLNVNVADVNEAPDFTNVTNGQTISIDENTTFVVDTNATDPEGDALTFSIVGGEDAARFSIDPATGVLSFLSAPDFEGQNSVSGDDVYDVTIRVADGRGGQQDVTLNVNVADVNEAPDFTNVTNGQTISIDENTTFVVDTNATDPEGDALTFSIVGGEDAARFSIDPATGVLSFLSAPDFEGQNSVSGDDVYDVTIRVADGRGGFEDVTLLVDVLDVLEGNGVVNGTAGDDDMPVGFVDIEGDIIDGADGLDDRIEADGGNDTVSAGLGDDTVSGGEGDDFLSGGAGDDSMAGDDGNDTLVGDAGADTLLGGIGDDSLVGGEDGDSLSGGSGADALDGQAGEDTLDGGEGDDALSGGADNDLLFGGDGQDSLDGGLGDDSLLGGDGADQMQGGDGDDTLRGDEAADTLLGNDGSDLLVGGDGNDVLEGSAGEDDLFGGEGDDTLDGGAENDTLSGAGGDDLLLLGDGDDRAEGGSGSDVLFGGEGEDTLLGQDGTDNIFGGNGDDVLDSRGSLERRDVPFLDLGPEDSDPFDDIDIVYGDDGNDRILTGDDADEIYGGSGRDTVDGGIDADLIFGDGGDDVIIGGEGTDIVEGGEGNDLIYGGVAPGQPDLFSRDDSIDIAPDNDLDTLDGGIGDDTIFGGDDADVIYGGDGNDSLFGGLDDDWIEAGLGSDTVTGGAGADVFVFTQGSDLVITDFTLVDQLALTDYFTSLAELLDDFADDLIINQSIGDFSDNLALSGSITMLGASDTVLTTDTTGLL